MIRQIFLRQRDTFDGRKRTTRLNLNNFVNQYKFHGGILAQMTIFPVIWTLLTLFQLEHPQQRHRVLGNNKKGRSQSENNQCCANIPLDGKS